MSIDILIYLGGMVFFTLSILLSFDEIAKQTEVLPGVLVGLILIGIITFWPLFLVLTVSSMIDAWSKGDFQKEFKKQLEEQKRKRDESN